MNFAEFQRRGLNDPRLAAHAASPLPAWLWSADGTHILWANPPGAALFDAEDGNELAARQLGPADPHRRQVARLASRLPVTGARRMERLQGFGAAPGMLATCACSRFDFPDGSHGVLVVAAELSPRLGPRLARPKKVMPAGEAPAGMTPFDVRSPREPSPDVEPVTDAPVGVDLPAAPAATSAPAAPPPWLGEAADWPQHPLRFLWQTDRNGRFSLNSDPFIHIVGARSAAALGKPWPEIAAALDIDSEGRLSKALATRETWSGVALDWPVDGGDRLAVELSGLPVFDRDRGFAGYRGFGICRDLEALARVAARRRHEWTAGISMPQPLSADIVQAGPAGDSPAEVTAADSRAAASATPDLPEPELPEHSPSPDLDAALDTPLETLAETAAQALSEPPKNILPFRPVGDAKPPVLTPVENSAFHELARQLSARLEPNHSGAAPAPEVAETAAEPAAATAPETPSDAPEWLAPAEPPARGVARRDRSLLDLVPAGVLIYRLDRLLYANPAFLRGIGFDSLQALEEAGGLDALYVEPGVSTASSTSKAGTPVTISASGASAEDGPPAATEARLYTISWDDDTAHALICSAGEAVASEPADAPAPEAGQADAEDLAAILDATAEAILMFDAEGNIHSCNGSAERLFGHDGEALVQRNLFDLFAPESQRAMIDYLDHVKSSDTGRLPDTGHNAVGRARGDTIPLSVTFGRTRADGPNFFAVFGDLSQSRQSESELRQARRLSERAANAKADMLARISHEVRTPLNAIIGFAEVMIGERFGALGNERYAEYLKDIRASGERVISIIDDLLDLSRIETGKLDLAFAHQNLNETVENCVAAMQPQANRERIIIRTSLAHTLPPVLADARALRQIALNLIGSSIHLAKAGGQVIVSTAMSDFGEVMLRVRDTGQALNDNEVAAALEPFRSRALSDQAADGTGISLSLTKALVEANRAQFHIKPGSRSGTLIEVVFSRVSGRS